MEWKFQPREHAPIDDKCREYLIIPPLLQKKKKKKEGKKQKKNAREYSIAGNRIRGKSMKLRRVRP